MPLKKVRVTKMSGFTGLRKPGTIYQCEVKKANDLISKGYLEPLTKPKKKKKETDDKSEKVDNGQ